MPGKVNGGFYIRLDGNADELTGALAKAYTPIVDESEARANARLIAAAPDLLTALDDLLELAVFMSGSPDFSPEGQAAIGWQNLEGVKRLMAARDAIAKATGTTP